MKQKCGICDNPATWEFLFEDVEISDVLADGTVVRESYNKPLFSCDEHKNIVGVALDGIPYIEEGN